MRAVKIAALALSCLLLLACGSWHGTGVVIEKDHTAAWTQVTTTCHPSGNTTVCSPNMTYWPESWDLRIRDDQGDKHWVDVSEAEYTQAAIGARFTNGEG
jgi:hypothetical protein